MVSGFVTSPWDQLRMTSGDAKRMRMELNAARRRCSCSSSRLNPNFPAATLSGDCSSVSCILWCLLGSNRGAADGDERRSAPHARLDFFELHFQAEALQFLHENVERLGHARLGR